MIQFHKFSDSEDDDLDHQDPPPPPGPDHEDATPGAESCK